jgi:hypothetical protein
MTSIIDRGAVLAAGELARILPRWSSPLLRTAELCRPPAG